MTGSFWQRAWVRSAVALACAVLGGGCALFGGQTGQEDGSFEGPVDCAYEPMPIAADTVTQLGFSSAEVESALATPISESLLWHRMNTRSQLTLQLLETRARFLKVSTQGTCPDVLELDARVAIETADGLLDEQLDATIEADAVDHATVSAELAPDAVMGTLTLELLGLDPSNWSEPEFSIRLQPAQGRLSGNISFGGGDPNPNDNASPTSAAIAELPAP